MTISSGRNGKRTKTGCLTCRKRKKKCDEHHPTCHGCSKNNIQCIWGQQRRKERLHRPQGYNKDFAVPQELSHCITIFAAPSMTLQQRMISHFADYCPIWISSIRVREGSNFMASLMPIAMRNALVMECLLAVATGDVGKIAGESIEIGRLSAHHYARASAGLSVAITREMEAIRDEEVLASDDNLVAVLLLCVHEAVNFTSPDRLLIHINGAILLISNRLKSPLPPKNPDLRGFLLEVFYYFFTMAASTHCSLIKSDDQFAYQVFHSPFLQGHHGRGMLLGAQSEVFHIILRLSLALNRYSQSASDHSTLQIELSLIQSDLLRIPINAEPDPNSQSQDTSSLTELHITSKLYYLACQSLLYQIMYQDDALREDLIHETMRQFFETLECLPFSSPANGVLCWPLFIAGLSSRTGKCRSIVLSRLRMIETDWRSHVALQASKQLTRIWKDTRQGVGVLMISNSYSNITKLPMILV